MIQGKSCSSAVNPKINTHDALVYRPHSDVVPQRISNFGTPSNSPSFFQGPFDWYRRLKKKTVNEIPMQEVFCSSYFDIFFR